MPPHRPVLDSVYGSVHDDFAPLLVRQSGAYTVDEVTPRFPKAARVAVVALVALTGVMAVVASAPAASVAMVHAGIRMQAWARATGADGDSQMAAQCAAACPSCGRKEADALARGAFGTPDKAAINSHDPRSAAYGTTPTSAAPRSTSAATSAPAAAELAVAPSAMPTPATSAGAAYGYSLDGTTYEVTRNGYASQTHTFTC